MVTYLLTSKTMGQQCVNLSHAKQPRYGRLDTKNPVDFRFGLSGDSQAFYEFKDKITPQKTHHDKFYEYPVSPTHFMIIDYRFDLYMANLKKLIRLAKSISKDVIIYITPNDGADVIRREFNMSNLDRLVKAVNIACKKYDAVCLNPNISAREYYFDTIHFTLKGHRVMADLLFAVISRGIKVRFCNPPPLGKEVQIKTRTGCYSTISKKKSTGHRYLKNAYHCHREV
jgi:hypothetical protein